jgi:hypothetical protein
MPANILDAHQDKEKAPFLKSAFPNARFTMTFYAEKDAAPGVIHCHIGESELDLDDFRHIGQALVTMAEHFEAEYRREVDFYAKNKGRIV